MHANSRLHQSIGPGSVVINKTDERDLRVTQARLRDLAFAVDVSDAAMIGGATLGEIWDKGTISAPDPKYALPSPTTLLQQIKSCSGCLEHTFVFVSHTRLF